MERLRDANAPPWTLSQHLNPCQGTLASYSATRAHTHASNGRPGIFHPKYIGERRARFGVIRAREKETIKRVDNARVLTQDPRGNASASRGLRNLSIVLRAVFEKMALFEMPDKIVTR